MTVTGNFRGRNLFGDTPAAPGDGRYDFVLRGAEGAIWVTGIRPRGRNFDLDLDRRIDTDKWVEVTGVVTNVCDFGAFVDLGGIEGLIHVSEVSWSRVGHPGDVLSCNQTVQVSVLSLDADQGRVALSLKRLRPDPWANVEQRY